jgi:hypothetical protein
VTVGDAEAVIDRPPLLSPAELRRWQLLTGIEQQARQQQEENQRRRGG